MRRLLTLLTALAALLPVASASGAESSWGGGDSKTTCVYSAHKVSTLNEFSAMVGRNIDCALVYNDASPDWAGWEDPWFLHHGDPNYNWKNWAKAPGTDRHLIITQNLFPSSENNLDWRNMGAAGDYEEHARTLARNLVAAGLGDSVIRLGHEANGTWYPDSIGSSEGDYRLWVRFWRNTVFAMRSVPGANFHFDWCVNAGVRPIDLAAFYPGDDAVDIVGIDAYDAGVPTNQTDRWRYLTTRTDGIGDVERFAAAHDKPMSIPEWGVGPASSSNRGGDDPAYVDGIASVVRNNRFVYQSYFYNYDYATQLATGPLSLAAYIKHFGTAAPPPPPTVAPPPPPPPPSVAPSPPYPAPAPSVPVPAAAPSPPNFSTSAPAAKPAKAAPRHRAKRPHRKHKSHPRKRARRHA